MTLHRNVIEVGVRDLHDRLSEHLERVVAGQELVVTRRGKAIARVSPIDREDALAELSRRGLLTPPRRARSPRRPAIHPRRPVSDLVSGQRR